MAEFCWQCLAEGIFPEHPERNDLAGLVSRPGFTIAVLCEGCGFIYVNSQGQRVAHVGTGRDPENFAAQEREEQRAARLLELPGAIDEGPTRAEAEADERGWR